MWDTNMKASLLLAAGLASAMALPAVAAPRANVSIKDLDLSKSADVATFNTRLEEAAKKACKNEPAVILDSATRKFVRCATLVKNEAIAKLPEPGRDAVIAANASAEPASS